MLEAKTYVVLLSFYTYNKEVSSIFYGPKINAILPWDKTCHSLQMSPECLFADLLFVRCGHCKMKVWVFKKMLRRCVMLHTGGPESGRFIFPSSKSHMNGKGQMHTKHEEEWTRFQHKERNWGLAVEDMTCEPAVWKARGNVLESDCSLTPHLVNQSLWVNQTSRWPVCT